MHLVPSLEQNAIAIASIVVPATGDYKLWSRFEQPVKTENRFRVTVRQAGRPEYSAVMGEALPVKFFFGQWPTSQAGPSQIELTAIKQPEPNANRNVDFLFLTDNLTDAWRTENKNNP